MIDRGGRTRAPDVDGSMWALLPNTDGDFDSSDDVVASELVEPFSRDRGEEIPDRHPERWVRSSDRHKENDEHQDHAERCGLKRIGDVPAP